MFFTNPHAEGHILESEKNTIDIENEKLFSCAKSRLKTLNSHPCIRKKNIMHFKNLKKRLEQREIQE